MQAGDTSRLLSRISYCTADKMHDKVFAYIAQSQHSESLECHAFLCTKRKVVSGGTRPRGVRLRDLKTGGNPQESQVGVRVQRVLRGLESASLAGPSGFGQ